MKLVPQTKLIDLNCIGVIYILREFHILHVIQTEVMDKPIEKRVDFSRALCSAYINFRSTSGLCDVFLGVLVYCMF